MLKNLLLVCFSIAIATSCSKNNKESAANSGKDAAAINESDFKVEAIPYYCYMQVKGKDTVFVSIADNLGTITGKLFNKNADRESELGSLNGFAEGDTLILDFIYGTEPNTKSREVWFLKKEGYLLQGTGVYNSSQEVFANPSAVKFDEDAKFETVDCGKINRKFVLPPTKPNTTQKNEKTEPKQEKTVQKK